MNKDKINLLSVKQAAEILGVNRQRVQQLIESERLPAEKVGAYYVIKETDLELVKERKVGRPPKVKVEGES
jgi:excisionase family DNA binding protein